jgi:hypothetical protein
MAGTLKLRSDDCAAPLLGVSGAVLAGAASLFSLIFFLCQPAVSPNPGVAAYTPPAATRLVPLPRISDAPELPAETSSGLTALAQAQAGDQPAKPPRPAARKRPRVDPGERDQLRFRAAGEFRLSRPQQRARMERWAAVVVLSRPGPGHHS